MNQLLANELCEQEQVPLQGHSITVTSYKRLLIAIAIATG